MSLKTYDFDEKLDSLDIKFIERVIVDNVHQNITCDRCNHQRLVYINILRIEQDYYQLGDDCYATIKIKLSKIRDKSLHLIKIELEEGYYRYLEQEYAYGLDSAERILDQQHQMAGIRGRIRELALRYAYMPVAECKGEKREEAQRILEEIESLKKELREYNN